jgi:hypothetical protein
MTSERWIRCLSWFATRSAAEALREEADTSAGPPQTQIIEAKAPRKSPRLIARTYKGKRRLVRERTK